MTASIFFEQLDQQLIAKQPFAAYRPPHGKRVLGLLQATEELYRTENFSENGFLFSPFDCTQKSVLIPSEVSTSLSAPAPTTSQTNHNAITTTDSDAAAKHTRLIERGLASIQDHTLEKVVLSRTESVSSSQSPLVIFKRLLERYPSAFVYIWHHPRVGLWLGATPENLITLEDNRFEIMALAGTQPYLGTTDVPWGSKEIDEQRYVTNFIEAQVQPFAKRLDISETRSLQTGNLLHLQTSITGTLKTPLVLKELLQKLHPTPAVCGVPQAAAQRFILQHEGYDRGFYTGFLGMLNGPDSRTSLYVNLRCMSIQDGVAQIYVGGGITAQSNPIAEWQETVAKAAMIKNCL